MQKFMYFSILGLLLSAYHLEIINLLEKMDWVGKVADAHADAVLEA